MTNTISNLSTQEFDAVVSEKLRYIYVYIYKSAHTTLKRKLWQIENAYGYELEIPEHYFGVHYPKREQRTHEQPWPIYQESNKYLLLNCLMENYVKFTVVRNPYSRLLSGYLDKIKRRENLEADKKEQRRLHFKLKSYPHSFTDFVEQVCQEPDHNVNPHWQSQSYVSAFDFLHYDKIGHVEKLNDFYEFLKNHFPKIKENSLACSENVLHQTSATSQLIAFYTPELQEKVYQRYREDFINFGYSENLQIAAPIHVAKVSGSRQEMLKPFIGVQT